MRIQNSYIVPKTDQAGETPAARTSAIQSGNAVPPPDQTSEHVPAPEIQHLTALVQQQPEIREERVAAVTKRLANGEYQTRDAALQTADALTTAPD